MKKLQSRFYIYTKNIHSLFAKKLQAALQAKVKAKVLRTNKNVWCLNTFYVEPYPLNKIEQLKSFSSAGVPCPQYATTSDGARALGCRTIFARKLIKSTNGRGIQEFESDGEEYPVAPLYTEYIPKKSEYRAHVFDGEVIDIQEKKKRRGFEGSRNTRIRNHNNGYVYCRDGVDHPDGLPAIAINAVNAVGYSYGAVDIIYNEKRNQLYVLEVNTKPGLFGKTLDSYTNAIINKFNLELK